MRGVQSEDLEVAPSEGKKAEVLATCSGYKAMKEEVGDMPSVESFHQLV